MYPNAIEIDLKLTLQKYYNIQMQEIYRQAIANLDDSREVRKDGILNFLSFISKKLFDLSTDNSNRLENILFGKFNQVDNFISNVFENSIAKKAQKLTELRPMQLVVINGELKSIPKPLEKIKVLENGKIVTKYQTEGLSIDLFSKKPNEFKNQISEKAVASANLIKGITKEKAFEISQLIQKSFAEGKTKKEIEEDLHKTIKVGENRIGTIARDQIAKLSSEINGKNAENLGLSKYIWRTQNDSRVRDSHSKLEGMEFDYITGAQGLLDFPNSKHPGDDINCRCFREPIL